MALETSFANSWESIPGIATAAADDFSNGNDPHYPLIALDSLAQCVQGESMTY
jgi:hypothetical protein